VAEARPPYGFTDDTPAAGEQREAHGSKAETNVPLDLAGAGIQPGTRLRRPGLVDVTPTIAALLGTRPPTDTQGRALTESFEARSGAAR